MEGTEGNQNVEEDVLGWWWGVQKEDMSVGK